MLSTITVLFVIWVKYELQLAFIRSYFSSTLMDYINGL
jgi:hypothetical protein